MKEMEKKTNMLLAEQLIWKIQRLPKPRPNTKRDKRPTTVLERELQGSFLDRARHTLEVLHNWVHRVAPCFSGRCLCFFFAENISLHSWVGWGHHPSTDGEKQGPKKPGF
jgi:hypothetical protein